MSTERSSPAFTFGQNWLQYSRALDHSRLADAEVSVARLLQRSSLDGVTFLDVGAGSGLFSLAALRLGATRVTAIDRDHDCLRAVSENAARFLLPAEAERLEIHRGDVLDRRALPADSYDVVYAWGSLHHTGAMWQAIANAADCCAHGGTFVIAIYNETWTSPVWLRIKRFYHAAPRPLRTTMVAALASSRLIVRALTGKPVGSTGRGMTVWYDAVDWLGGLPYEYATEQRINDFLVPRGFTLVRCIPTRRAGCNEFVFVRTVVGNDGGR